MSKTRRIENRPWTLEVPAITVVQRREMAYEIMDQLHRERNMLELSQQTIADIIDSGQAAVSEGKRHQHINRLDFACGFAYAVKKRLVLVPWDEE